MYPEIRTCSPNLTGHHRVSFSTDLVTRNRLHLGRRLFHRSYCPGWSLYNWSSTYCKPNSPLVYSFIRFLAQMVARRHWHHYQSSWHLDPKMCVCRFLFANTLSSSSYLPVRISTLLTSPSEAYGWEYIQGRYSIILWFQPEKVTLSPAQLQKTNFCLSTSISSLIGGICPSSMGTDTSGRTHSVCPQPEYTTKIWVRRELMTPKYMFRRAGFIRLLSLIFVNSFLSEFKVSAEECNFETVLGRLISGWCGQAYTAEIFATLSLFFTPLNTVHSFISYSVFWIVQCGVILVFGFSDKSRIVTGRPHRWPDRR